MDPSEPEYAAPEAANGLFGRSLFLKAGAPLATMGYLLQQPAKTVGSFWPYATVLFNYIRRSMPYYKLKTLSNDELYSSTAYVLFLNGLVGPKRRYERGNAAEDTLAESKWLPAVGFR